MVRARISLSTKRPSKTSMAKLPLGYNDGQKIARVWKDGIASSSWWHATPQDSISAN